MNPVDENQPVSSAEGASRVITESEAPIASTCEGGANGESHSGPRIALVCSPRTGNTWLRHLLGGIFAIPSHAIHTPDEFDWRGAPSACVVAIRWKPTPEFVELLAEHRFRVVVLTRHPFDVLISILNFCQKEPKTRFWLAGEGGDELSILGAMPRSYAFLDYATGPRAAALLGVSLEWWRRPGVCRMRYVDLVNDPQRELLRLASELDAEVRRPPVEVIAAHTIVAPRKQWGTKHEHHWWQGKSGLWRSLLPATESRHIATAYTEHLAEWGYDCEPDPTLDARTADRNWLDLAWSNTTGYRKLQKSLAETEAALDYALGEVERLNEKLFELENSDPDVIQLPNRPDRRDKNHPRWVAMAMRLFLKKSA